MPSENYQIYLERREPPVLARLSHGKVPSYPSIKEITDKRVISSLIERLGEDQVIVSWVSPPYGKVVGYGIYGRKEAEGLLQRSKRENWGFPRIGRLYGVERLEKMLENFSRNIVLQI